MTIEVYIGERFRYGPERRAFGRFIQDMLNAYEQVEEIYFVVAEFDTGSAAIDLLLLHSRAMILADFKELTAADPRDQERIRLRGKQNGQWEYILPNGKVNPLGGKGKTSNPFQQLDRFRYEYADWLEKHSHKIFGEHWSTRQGLKALSAWVVISPGYDRDTSELDLPWEDIADNHYWFRAVPASELAWEFNCTSLAGLELSETQVRKLLSELGVTRLEDYSHIVPVAPPERDTFFSKPHLCGNLVDRTLETASLVEAIEDENVTVINIRGLGGIGKTTLAAWLAEVAREKNYQLRWVDCAEKEVTAESFLAAVASNLENRKAVGFLLDKEKYTLNERIDAAFELLSRQSTLIVLNDFHKAADQQDINTLLTHLVQHYRQIKVVLTTREYLFHLDNPAWRVGATREIHLRGLPREAVRSLVPADIGKDLSDEQCEIIYKRTSGNPYAIQLIVPLIRTHGWGDHLEQLPLFSAIPSKDVETWFASLMDTVSEPARQLALRLSVNRQTFSDEFIKMLWHEPCEIAQLKFELLNSNILEKAVGENLYTMHEFIREYLYNQLQPQKRTKFHQDAGKYFARQADRETVKPIRANHLSEAVSHFTRAQDWKEVTQQAVAAFDLLNEQGDWDRAQTVAKSALEAARGLQDQEKKSHWLVQIASRELDHDQVKEARQHLREAANSLPKITPRTPEEQKTRLRKLEAQIYLQNGRLEYDGADFAAADEYFDKVLALARATKDAGLEADCLVRIGRIERQQGEYERAKAHFEAAREFAEETNNRLLVLECISHLGLIARKKGEREAARNYFTRAYQDALASENEQAAEINLSLLGDLALRAGEFTQAEKVFRECLEISLRLENGKGIRINLGQLAETLTHLGIYEEAQRLLDEARQRCVFVGDGVGIAWTLKRQGLLLKVQGKIEAGDEAIRAGIEKLREIGNEDYIEDFQRALGPVQLGLFVTRPEQPPKQATLPGW
jgi:tetratricopeptide (TPR) repeat protein